MDNETRALKRNKAIVIQKLGRDLENCITKHEARTLLKDIIYHAKISLKTIK